MIYLKSGIEENLENNPNRLLKEISAGLEPYLQYYSVLRFNNLVKFIKSSFTEYNFFKIFGASGSGKSSFKTLLKNTFNQDINVFEYSCSEITELDDIFFKFYKFMGNYPAKSDFLRMTKNPNKNLSIDDQIMHYMKNTNGNTVLIFDNFEKLLNSNNEIKAENIKSFFEFIANISKLKVIVFTSINIDTALDLPKNSTFETRLDPLSFEQIQEFLAIFKLNVSPELYKEIYEQTSGYIFTLKFLATAVQILESSIEEILAESMRAEMSLNIYIAQRIVNKLLPNERKILNYFVFFRHEINENILKTIDNNTGNIQDTIDLLANYMLIDKDGIDHYRMRSFLKTMLYGSIIPAEKAKIHKKIATFYADQIPLNPNDRVLELSRTTMYSEKFYHFNIYSKLEKNIDLQNNKNEGTSLQPDTKFNSNTIKYIASTKYLPDFKSKNIDEAEHSKMLEEFKPFDNWQQQKQQNRKLDEDVETEEQPNYLENEFEDSENQVIQTNNDDANTILQQGIEFFNKGETSDSIRSLIKAIDYFENNNDENLYIAKLYLAKAYADNSKYEESKNILEELLNSNIDAKMNAEVLAEIATVYEYTQEQEFALKYYKQALDVAQKNNLQEIEAKVYFKLALLYDYINETEKALYNYMMASSNALDVKDKIIIAASYSNIASIYEEKKDYQKATEYYKKSLQEDERNENYAGQTKTLSALGNLYLAQKEYNVAIKFFIRETQTAKKTGDKYMMASSYLELGDTFFRKRDYKNAVKAYFLSKKYIDTTISTDSKNKIERRFDMIVGQIGESAYKKILNELRNA